MIPEAITRMHLKYRRHYVLTDNGNFVLVEPTTENGYDSGDKFRGTKRVHCTKGQKRKSDELDLNRQETIALEYRIKRFKM